MQTEFVDTTLFVGDLSIFCTKENLYDSFSKFGKIHQVRIKHGADGKRNLAYGFIKFTDQSGAANALKNMNGVLFLGRPLRLGWATSSKGAQKTPGTEGAKNVQVLTSFISKQADYLVTEETLRNVFNFYGPVVDVSIKKSSLDRETNFQTGYGFVHFSHSQEGIDAALAAIDSLNNGVIDGVAYDCRASDTLNQLLQGQNLNKNKPPPGSALILNLGGGQTAAHRGAVVSKRPASPRSFPGPDNYSSYGAQVGHQQQQPSSSYQVTSPLPPSPKYISMRPELPWLENESAMGSSRGASSHHPPPSYYHRYADMPPPRVLPDLYHPYHVSELEQRHYSHRDRYGRGDPGFGEHPTGPLGAYGHNSVDDPRYRIDNEFSQYDERSRYEMGEHSRYRTRQPAYIPQSKTDFHLPAYVNNRKSHDKYYDQPQSYSPPYAYRQRYPPDRPYNNHPFSTPLYEHSRDFESRQEPLRNTAYWAEPGVSETVPVGQEPLYSDRIFRTSSNDSSTSAKPSVPPPTAASNAVDSRDSRRTQEEVSAPAPTNSPVAGPAKPPREPVQEPRTSSPHVPVPAQAPISAPVQAPSVPIIVTSPYVAYDRSPVFPYASPFVPGVSPTVSPNLFYRTIPTVPLGGWGYSDASANHSTATVGHSNQTTTYPNMFPHSTYGGASKTTAPVATGNAIDENGGGSYHNSSYMAMDYFPVHNQTTSARVNMLSSNNARSNSRSHICKRIEPYGMADSGEYDNNKVDPSAAKLVDIPVSASESADVTNALIDLTINGVDNNLNDRMDRHTRTEDTEKSSTLGSPVDPESTDIATPNVEKSQ